MIILANSKPRLISNIVKMMNCVGLAEILKRAHRKVNLLAGEFL